METCYGWQYFYDEVTELVDELIMAHPLKTRLIAEAMIKTDSITVARKLLEFIYMDGKEIIL